jgi:cytochrome oxidase assembly protein ShyY1
MNDKEWYPRNKHGQYALFWYAMALALLGVYGAVRFLKKQGY